MNHFTSIKQVISHYNKLKGKTIQQIYDQARIDYPTIELTTKNKGIVGQVFEAAIGQKPNSNPNPDIENLSLELKVLPVRKMGYSLQPKERSKIKSINYNSIIKENWQNSEVKKKIDNVLFFIYEHPTGVKYNELDKLKFKGVLHFDLSSSELADDLVVIKADWEQIQSKVENGEADLLSESLTQHLVASTSGTGKLVSYGGNKEAKQRSYSLKHTYLKYYFLKNKRKLEDTGKSVNSIVDILHGELINKNLLELSKKYNLKFDKKSKSGFRNLVNAILKIENGKLPAELVKENLGIKTIPISHSVKAFEAMSFPKFSLVDLLYEKWNIEDESSQEEAVFKNIISDGFVFITIEKIKNKELDRAKGEKNDPFNSWEEWIIRDVFRWKPTVKELKGIEQEWNQYKNFIESNQLIITPTKNKSGKIVNKNNLPKYTRTQYIHIRPHTNNGFNLDLPFENKFNKKISWQSFWFNKDFINRIIAQNREK